MIAARLGVARVLLPSLAMLVAVMGLTCPPSGEVPGGVGDSGLTGKFVGSERCSQCHQNYHTNWANTLHAKAYETLEAIGQGANADCLGCHTVGFGQEGGFKDRATTNALASVGCENCHGPGRDHVSNVTDVSLRPKIDISAAVCGQCHTGAHQPNYDDWLTSKHAAVEPVNAGFYAAGTAGRLNNCGTCHSGDFRYRAIIKGQTVPDTLLQGLAPEQMNGITCVICHDPHQQTGNAAKPDTGRDFQLRYAQAKTSAASSTIADAVNPERFNICGQCHHSRGRTYASTMAPHHSIQANMYNGEMPVPDGDPPLVPSNAHAHGLAAEQCSSCHVYRRPFVSDMAPAISGHTFQINFAGCVVSGCHPNEENPRGLLASLHASIEFRLNSIRARLGNPATWEYTGNGGPNTAGQNALDVRIKQVRFIYYYVLNDGSLGAHNPDFARDCLTKAENLLTALGL